MATRRPMGALEQQVMDYLWTVDDPMTPAEVHEVVAPDLAYTTVMTVLSRLCEKGRLHRERRGRAYEYSAMRTEAEHRAESMTTSLERAADRAAVLSNFVESLGDEDASTLRKLLLRCQ